MFINTNHTFRITISREHYESKQDVTACLSTPGARAIGREKMAWMEHEVSIDGFMQLATSGYCFCNLFDFNPAQRYWIETKDGKKRLDYPTYHRGANKGYMKIQFKADRFFRGAQTIFVDVDFTRFNNVQDYLATLSIPPTCVYMSFSDNKEKPKSKIVSRRFRMVYVFSEILNAKEFEYISHNITYHIIADTGEPMDDDCGTRKSQYMNGVFANDETYRSDYIYSKYDFAEGGLFYEIPVIEDVEATDEEVDNAPEFNERMVIDMERLSYEEFMHYYSKRLCYIYRVEHEGWIESEQCRYQFTDDSYLQLYYYRERVMDGQHRRRKLYYAGCLRRVMWPEIDADTLLFNLYIDRERFYDNSDGVITITHLKRKVLRVLKMSLEELTTYCGSTIAYWKANRPRIIFKSGCRYSFGMMRQVYKEIRYREIDEQYDPMMSVKENIDAGLDIPQSTLYRYCAERGYSTDPNRPISVRKQQEEKRKEKEKKIERFTELYDRSLSPKENMDALAAHGLTLPYSTLLRWRDTFLAPLINIEPPTLPDMSIRLDFTRYKQEENSIDEEVRFEENNWPNFWEKPQIRFNWPNF